jgi:hypothetical protein
VVPIARPMPLQSLAQRTVKSSPLRDWTASLEVGSAWLDNASTAPTEVDACCRRRLWHRGWLAFAATASGAPGLDRTELLPLLRRLMSVRAVRPAFGRARRSCRPRSGLLSWGSSKIAPSPVQMPSVHSRVGRGPPFGSELPNSGRVPPLPFFPTSAVYSARHPAGLLHPASGHGVRHVSGLPLLFARRLGAGARLPRWRHTLRSFPLRGRSVRVTVLRFPHAVVRAFRSRVRPCCHGRALVLPAFARPQGFAPLRSPLRLAGVAAVKLPDAPLGLVPGWFIDTVPAAAPRSGSWRVPLAVRRPRGGRPRMVPLWSEDRAGVIHGIRVLRRSARGRGDWAPVAGLVGSWAPRGFGPVRPVRRWVPKGPPLPVLAGHPRAAALLGGSPATRGWLRCRRLGWSAPEGAGCPRSGRVGRHPRAPSREGVAASPRRRGSTSGLSPAYEEPCPAASVPEVGGVRTAPAVRALAPFSLDSASRGRPCPRIGATWALRRRLDRGLACPEGRAPPGPRRLLALPRREGGGSALPASASFEGRFRGLGPCLLPRGEGCAAVAPASGSRLRGVPSLLAAVRGSGQCRHRSSSPATSLC